MSSFRKIRYWILASSVEQIRPIKAELYEKRQKWSFVRVTFAIRGTPDLSTLRTPDRS